MQIRGVLNINVTNLNVLKENLVEKRRCCYSLEQMLIYLLKHRYRSSAS